MKLFIGINTLTAVEQPVYASHLNLFQRLGKDHPDWTVGLYTPRRTSIDRMRNSLAKMALEGEYDYIAFIDDDVIVPYNLFDKLLALEADIAAGWTIIRGYPFENMFFNFDESQQKSIRRIRIRLAKIKLWMLTQLASPLHLLAVSCLKGSLRPGLLQVPLIRRMFIFALKLDSMCLIARLKLINRLKQDI